jgi:hypothetical protein
MESWIIFDSRESAAQAWVGIPSCTRLARAARSAIVFDNDLVVTYGMNTYFVFVSPLFMLPSTTIQCDLARVLCYHALY